MIRLCLVFVVGICMVYGQSDPGEDVKECYRKLSIPNTITPEGDANRWQYCVQRFKSYARNYPWKSQSGKYKLRQQPSQPLHPFQMVEPRVRKEYRQLTEQERSDFHRSINLLKQDTSIAPNVFDSIAALHTGSTAYNAHNGPTFLLWHRIYVKMMEDALRQKVPSVTIPFWDPTLDSSLSNIRDSILWTENLMGTINGFVTKGPFANWKTPAGNLVRNGGFRGDLPTRRNIEDVLNRTRLSEISEPNANEQYNFEFMHDNMHISIGGHVGAIATSPMDPVFWLIHSFVELVHTRFNENQRRNNVDPATDYPSDYGLDVFAPNQSIGLLNLTVAEALEQTQSYRYMYRYDDEYFTGNCSLNPSLCNPLYLTCKNDRCVSKAKESPKCGTLIPYQNIFCVNDICDLNEWAFIPIEVIYERSYETMKFGNFPVVNGHPNLLNDIYDNNLPQNSTSGNSTCRRNKCSGAAGRLNIQASGINYFGNYEEMVIVDRRLAVTSNIAYIGIRNPVENSSQVFLTVSEQCGRICRPSCIVEGSNPPRYTPCIGLLNITANDGEYFSNTLAGAYMKIWNYKNQVRPKLRHRNIMIVFHCDEQRWPYTNDTNIDISTSTITTPLTATMTTSPTTTTLPTETSTTTTRPTKFCYLSSRCTVTTSCRCKPYQKEACSRKCSRYALCNRGRFITIYCGFGKRFDPKFKKCVYGYCYDWD
ncbi:putative tyrosinase-like protein tyr-1, partial [Argonauta hians]